MIIYREIGIYILAFLLTMGIGLYGYITWWNSVLLLACYGLLIGVVLVQEVASKI